MEQKVEGQVTPPAMVLVAKLDHDNVYFGLAAKPLADVEAGDLIFGDPSVTDFLPTGAVYVAVSCDNKPGMYMWQASGGCFVPLSPEKQKVAEAAPTLEQAFYALLATGADSPAVQAWVRWFEASVDARG